VELAAHDTLVALRDSKRPGAEPFRFTRGEIQAFIDGVKRGEFDDFGL
jgi:hypothetical protein